MSTDKFSIANEAVIQTAFANGITWKQQAAGVSATNGSPTLASDGENIRNSAGFIVQVLQETATLDADIQIWGYANDAWSAIPSGVYETIGPKGLIEASVFGGVFDRIYIEVTRLGGGQADLNIGFANA